MYSYSAFRLHINSDISLPGLVSADGECLPRVAIRQECIPEDWLPLHNDNGACLAGTARGLMRFRVERGELIAFDPVPDADIDYIRAILSGELLAALLRQRGLLVLHASSVVREDGEAVGFIGNSGWGKSTLASYFVRQGYRLLSDDILAIDQEGGDPLVVPGYPQVKLAPDSGERLIEDYHTLSRAHSETSKRLFIQSERFQSTSARLKKLYVLEGASAERNEIAPLPAKLALIELLRHTRVTQLIKDREYVAAHFASCSELLRKVPVARLHRTMSLALLPELYHLIEQDLASLQDSMVTLS